MKERTSKFMIHGHDVYTLALLTQELDGEAVKLHQMLIYSGIFALDFSDELLCEHKRLRMNAVSHHMRLEKSGSENNDPPIVNASMSTHICRLEF